MLALAPTLAHSTSDGPHAAYDPRAFSRHPSRHPSSSSSYSASSASSASSSHPPAATPSRSLSQSRSAVVAPHPVASTSRLPPTPTQQHPPPAAHSAPPKPARPRLDLPSYNSQDLLKHLAVVLNKMASSNDQLQSPDFANPQAAVHGAIWDTLTSASRASLDTTQSSLTFHARNVPTISLEAYLLRILKYCPTTNEVFLSLLVYFDRMAKLSKEATGRAFVIDSYNIHRLVIAGVTVASKFFSDVFYTNSRYAKVGGLPQSELNQLELQFLLLNNFQLMVSPEEMQKYAEDLIVFSQAHAPQRPAAAPRQESFASTSTNDESETEYGDAETSTSTDDEPTIRPAASCAGSDAQSLYSVETEDEDERDQRMRES